MSIKVRIPTPLQKLTNNQGEVEVKGNNVKEVLEALEADFKGFRERLYDDQGQLRRFVNIYVNEEDIRFLEGEKTAVKNGDDATKTKTATEDLTKELSKVYEAIQKAGGTPPPNAGTEPGQQSAPSDNPEQK